MVREIIQGQRHIAMGRWFTAVRKDVALWSTSNVQQTRRDVSEKGGKWGTTGKCVSIAGKMLSSSRRARVH